MKGKHKGFLRLGVGEFQYASGFNAARQERGYCQDGPTKARLHKEALLLDAMIEVQPEVLGSRMDIFEILPKATVDGQPPPVPQQAVDRWCNRWNLGAPWCPEFAEQQLLKWWFELQPGGEDYSEKALGQRAHLQEMQTQPFSEQSLTINFGPWPITVLTREKFEERCKRRFERKLGSFCKRIEAKALTSGMERTREKREHDHFYWLARRLVLGQRAVDIKEFGTETVSARAIAKAIVDLARELELPLPRGRSSFPAADQ